MNYISSKAWEISNFLSYRYSEISQEGCQNQLDEVIKLLLSMFQDQVISFGPYLDAGPIYKAFRVIHYIENVSLPSTAVNTQRIFEKNIKFDFELALHNQYKPVTVDFKQDWIEQAIQFENLASVSSYDLAYMTHVLKASLYCFLKANHKRDSDDVKRIETLIQILKAECKIIDTKFIVLQGLKEHQIPFSVKHERFAEVLADCQESDNPRECRTKWITTLRKSFI